MESFSYVLILFSEILVSIAMVSGHRAIFNPAYSYISQRTHETIYDVTKFGAVGNARTDDSKAFQSAWKEACENESNNVKVIVPGGKTFLVSTTEFEGPCKSRSITFEISGKIVAPSKSAWKNKSADEWLYFHQVDGLNVLGNGLIDGQGDSWWKDNGGSRPTALRFSHCNNLQVSGLKHTNSQKNHISINDCHGVTISHLQIAAPPKSPNTDGIDISSSTNLHIHDCVMATGDDCIAINGGNSNIFIGNIVCGPGHGISIGSLGKDGSYDTVEAIHVTNCTFKNTQNGVRIKTWQGGSGYARNITFSKITFIEADNPILIDQYYCPHMKCANKTSAVKISDVSYIGLHGTSIPNSKNATINFSCSKVVPCTNIVLDDVHITSAYQKDSTSAHCINAQGTAHQVTPIVNCLSNTN